MCTVGLVSEHVESMSLPFHAGHGGCNNFLKDHSKQFLLIYTRGIRLKKHLFDKFCLKKVGLIATFVSQRELLVKSNTNL